MQKQVKHLLFFIVGIGLGLTSCGQQTGSQAPTDVVENHQKEVEAHRAAEHAKFLGDESPLKPEDKAAFKGLHYYPVKHEYRVVGKFKHNKRGRTFKMATSTDRKPVYKVFGTITFELEGQPQELTVYQNLDLIETPGYEDYLFLPFVDGTNGDETYGGGRYLDMRIPTSDKVTLDFNLAYNPYCCYSDKYSCPIPPKENFLTINIPAGEKNFGEAH